MEIGLNKTIDNQIEGEAWNTMTVLDSLTSKNSEEFNSSDHSRLSQLAVNASWLVNWFLLAAKAYAVIVSSSKAVTAALADSAVDLVSQAILALADRYMSRHSPNYPVGRSRLEALSVIACAFIMSMASIESMKKILLLLFYLHQLIIF